MATSPQVSFMNKLGQTIVKKCCLFVCLIISGILTALPVNSAPHGEELVDNGGFLLMDETGKKIGFHAQKPFIPASTVKILTSLAALETMGENFKFTTNFYYDQHKNLYIQGGGDPFLVSEEIKKICKELRLAGIREIKSIILDDTLYQLAGPANGAEATLQPYDAHNSALAVNFNTVHIKVLKDGSVISAEKQTPTTQFLNNFKFLPPGQHRINLNQLKNLALAPHLQYAGELFREFLLQENIVITSTSISSGKVPASLQAILEWQSDYLLKEIISMYLLSSSNFMTNQVFLMFGLRQKGAPATWEKSRESINEFISKRFKLSSSTTHIEEGSGLSRKTCMSPEAMIDILEEFKPHHQLLAFSPRYKLHYKTGTLENVYCLAGYIPKNNKLLPFAIFLNQKKNNRDEILKRLIAEADK